MTNIRKIALILTSLTALAVLVAYCTIKFTHGFVIFESYAYKSLDIEADAGNGIQIVGELHPPVTCKYHRNGWGVPKIEKSSAFDLIEWARINDSHVRLRIRSKKPLNSAYIKELSVIDNLGKESPQHLQNLQLISSNGKSKKIFANTELDWYGFKISGSGVIQISGQVTFEENDMKTPFHVSIPIDCLRMKTIMSRKEWDKFFK